MSDQYVGEIRMFAGNYAPQGWVFCNGQLLSIRENEVLYALIGTTYGGDGQTTFAVPDLRGRVPVGQGKDASSNSSYTLGQMGGSETVTLTSEELPAHTHTVRANNDPNAALVNTPENNVWAYSTVLKQYQKVAPNVSMSPNTVSSVGGNQPHNNVMPSTVTSFIIALTGIFPSNY